RACPATRVSHAPLAGPAGECHQPSLQTRPRLIAARVPQQDPRTHPPLEVEPFLILRSVERSIDCSFYGLPETILTFEGVTGSASLAWIGRLCGRFEGSSKGFEDLVNLLDGGQGGCLVRQRIAEGETGWMAVPSLQIFQPAAAHHPTDPPRDRRRLQLQTFA